jgi:hypothetical protein
MKANLVMMLGYTRADHLMAKMTPFLMLRTMMMSATSEAEVLTGESEAKRDDSSRQIDESGRGPKRAVAKAIARFLKIQPGIHGTEDSSSKRPVARV